MHEAIVEHPPAEALQEIKRMARCRLPTWKKAEAAVFSSTDESLDDTTTATTTPSDPRQRSMGLWASPAALPTSMSPYTPTTDY